MPEVRFHVRWPDGVQRSYYSPSTVVHVHLRSGESYALSDFLKRARAAMHEASERVRATYGRPCSLALNTLSQIDTTAQAFAAWTDAEVSVVAVPEQAPL
jgi:uncharacterized repeat protein (TIGR04042 family)